MTKKKKGDKTTVDDDHAPGGTAGVRPGGAATSLRGEGGRALSAAILGTSTSSAETPARGPATARGRQLRARDERTGVRESANARGGSGSGSGSIAHSVKEPEASPADSSVGHHGNAWLNLQEQFRERMRVADGDFARALWNEREHLALGLGVGLLQGTVGIGGGVLVTTYMSIVGDTEVHRMCATALCATLVTSTAVCTQLSRATCGCASRRARVERRPRILRREKREPQRPGAGHQGVHRHRARRQRGEHAQVTKGGTSKRGKETRPDEARHPRRSARPERARPERAPRARAPSARPERALGSKKRAHGGRALTGSVVAGPFAYFRTPPTAVVAPRPSPHPRRGV